MKNFLQDRNARAGMTLVELVIAVALIGVGILASVGAFSLIQKSIQSSKGRTLATNLAQEKMQIIMQQPYFDVLVTTNPYTDTDFSPNFAYDNGYFPPETILQGSIQFTRMTNIQVAQEVGGVIQTLPSTTPDTGLRQITVNVVWQSATGKQLVTVQNVVNNPNTVMSNASIKGQITDSVTHAPLTSSLVDVAENIGWRTYSNSLGNYTINLSPGNFHVTASALGYYATGYYLSIAPNSPPYIQNIPLTPISTGTISGTAWLNSHLIISQIVGSSVTTAGYRQSFVELYNPTTFYINIAAAGVPSVLLKWQKQGDAFPTTWALNYVLSNSTVAPNAYYLIANTTTIKMGGISRNADALFDITVPNYPNPILIYTDPGSQAASIGITTAGGAWIDQVGWTQGGIGLGNYPPFYETTPILNFVNGLADGQQYVRRCSTMGVSNPPIGRAYDDNYNAMDFVAFNPSLFVPRNSGDIEAPIAGTPAVGANVSITDGVSISTKAVQMGNPPYALFTIPGVATGTWTAFVDSNTSSAEIDNVNVVYNTTTSIPNASTSPTWPAVGANAVILSTSGIVGTIVGNVTDILFNAPGSWTPAGVSVGIAGQTYPVSLTTGRYQVRLPTGTYTVTANPSLGNAGYESQTQTGVNVTLGDETTNVNFQLAQGGQLSGWVTRDGVNPLPGVSVVALDASGNAHDTEVSANNGAFTLINLTTGTYTVQPVLDSKEASSPVTFSSTVVAGSNLVIGTFTVSGAMGTVSGTVSAAGHAIQTGVLVVISTASIAASPPAISSNTLTGASYYAGSSQEDGSYTIEVRGSTSSVYNVAAYYMRLNGQTVVTSSQTISNVTVTAGQPTSGKNFSW
jgi:prepilin-type N-terminal cleavage/methylation domain-containing protein